MMATCPTDSACSGGVPPDRPLHPRTGSFAIVMYYVLFGLCWILFSEILLTKFVTNPDLYSTISVAKGWLFIAITALLLYVLIKRRVRMVLALQSMHANEIGEHERRIFYANRLYTVLSSVNRSIIRIADQRELLDEICRILVVTGGFKTTWIGWPDDDGWIVPQASCGDDPGRLAAIRTSVRDIPEGQGPTGTAIRERRPVVCDNIATNPAMIVWREIAAQNGYASSASFPFILPDGSTAGLNIYSTAPDFFCDDEMRLLCEVADDMQFALQMLHTAAAHRVAEQRLREIIDNSPAVIYAFDCDGRLLLANAAMAAICNLPAVELYGRRREEIGLSPESAQLQRANDLQVLAAGQSQVFEETNLEGDAIRTYLTVKFPLTSLNEGVSRVVAGISTDITERKRAEQDLQEKNSELERFTYTVSHDLKSPLITINTFAGMIQKDFHSGNYANIPEDLNRICDAASKMGLLLDDLLQLSRIGRMMNEPTRIDMNGLVRETLGLLDGSISQRQIEIVAQPDLPEIFGDRQRIGMVLQNLFENAVKYLGNQLTPRIGIGARRTGHETVFYIEDNGIGIEARQHENIFGLFKKLDAKSPGTGIGLALAKRIIDVHGGRIWVESEGSGTGSRFLFTVPEGCDNLASTRIKP
jgi:PAS domain S-box-containing protein